MCGKPTLPGRRLNKAPFYYTKQITVLWPFSTKHTPPPKTKQNKNYLESVNNIHYTALNIPEKKRLNTYGL